MVRKNKKDIELNCTRSVLYSNCPAGFYSFAGGSASRGRFLFLISLNSNSKRAYRWANSLFRSVNLEMTTEKWRLIKMRNKKANKKMVEAGVTAPTRWVIHFKRSNHNVRTRMTDPVISHNHEYSSSNFFLLTNSIMNKSIPMPTARATIIFRRGIISSSRLNTIFSLKSPKWKETS